MVRVTRREVRQGTLVADGRSRGGDEEAEEEEEEVRRRGEADKKFNNNPHLTDTKGGWCQRGYFDMSWRGSLEVQYLHFFIDVIDFGIQVYKAVFKAYRVGSISYRWGYDP